MDKKRGIIILLVVVLLIIVAVIFGTRVCFADTSDNQTGKITLNGQVSNMGKASSAYLWFSWGYDQSCSQNTTRQVISKVGTYSTNITSDLSRTIYYKMMVSVGKVAISGNIVSYEFLDIIPNAPDLSYVLACVNKWVNGRMALSRLLSVINAWNFPRN